jgi:hypothetical protein
MLRKRRMSLLSIDASSWVPTKKRAPPARTILSEAPSADMRAIRSLDV